MSATVSGEATVGGAGVGIFDRWLLRKRSNVYRFAVSLTDMDALRINGAKCQPTPIAQDRDWVAEGGASDDLDRLADIQSHLHQPGSDGVLSGDLYDRSNLTPGQLV